MHISKKLSLFSLIVFLLFSSQAVNAVSSLSQKEEQHLLNSLKDPKVKVRMSLAYKSLYGENTKLKNNVMKYLGKRGDVNSVSYLIDALLEQDTNLNARRALKELTGEDFGFNWNAPIKEKTATVRKWKKWIEERDGIIKEIRLYAPKHNISLSKYKIYRVHLDADKIKWYVSFTTTPPKTGTPSIVVDRDTHEKIIIYGR